MMVHGSFDRISGLGQSHLRSVGRPYGYLSPELSRRAADLSNQLEPLCAIRPVLRSRYFVKEWLDRGAFSVVYEESNVGKTFFAFDLAIYIAAASDWHGHRLPLLATAMIVAYAAGEGGDGIKNRIDPIRREHHELVRSADARSRFLLLPTTPESGRLCPPRCADQLVHGAAERCGGINGATAGGVSRFRQQRGYAAPAGASPAVLQSPAGSWAALAGVTAFEQMLRAETEAQAREEDYQPGNLVEDTIGGINFPLLTMVARMVHRVVKDHVDGKAVSKSKAAQMVSERHSTVRLPNGKPVPSSPDRMRKAFDQYLPSAHLWAAVETAMPLEDGRKIWGDQLISAMMVDQAVLVDVLVCAAQVREHLAAA